MFFLSAELILPKDTILLKESQAKAFLRRKKSVQIMALMASCRKFYPIQASENFLASFISTQNAEKTAVILDTKNNSVLVQLEMEAGQKFHFGEHKTLNSKRLRR